MRYSLPLGLLMVAQVSAQSLSILVQEGDLVPGVGLVTNVVSVELGTGLDAFVHVETDNALQPRNEVILRNSGVYLRENQLVDTPPISSRVGGFDGISVNGHGAPIVNLALRNGLAGLNEGVYFDGNIVVTQSDVFTAPELTTPKIYTAFSDVQFGPSDTFWLAATIADSIAAPTEEALMAVTLDPTGTVASHRLVIKENDMLPGQALPVRRLALTPERYAVNVQGSTIFSALLTSPFDFSTVLYQDDTLLLQQGTPSPIAGRTWGEVYEARVDMNDSGSWVALTNLDSSDITTNQVLVRDGEILFREGDSLPDIAPFKLRFFGWSSGVSILPNGDVLWTGIWDDPDTTRARGIFLNDRLILQQGVTSIGGALIVDLTDSSQSQSVSADGQYFITKGKARQAATDLDVAILIDLSVGTPFCDANANSSGQPATLFGSGPASVAANGLSLRMTKLPPSSTGLFLASRSQGFTPLAGGGEGNLCLGGDIGRFLGPGQVQQSGAAGVLSLAIDLTQIPQPTGAVSVLVGEQWNFQGWYRDTSASGPTSNFTNGVAVSFGL